MGVGETANVGWRRLDVVAALGSSAWRQTARSGALASHGGDDGGIGDGGTARKVVARPW